MSRTFLMHNYADQRTHDFFLNRDYPPVENLTQVFRALSEDPRAVEELRAASRLGEEEFDKALEKLEIHGGARRDFGGNVTVGGMGWKKTYSMQAQYRAEQFAKVLRYTELNECRMSALVRHFGDVEDAKHPCGECDVCDPGGAVLRLFRRATAAEMAIAQRIVEELRGVEYKATGTLQRNLDLVGRISRDEYEGLLGAMVQSHLIEMEEAEFEKDGQIIRFRKVRLTEDGRRMRPEDSTQLLISDGVVEEFAGRGPAPSRAKSTKPPAQKASSSGAGLKTAVAAEPVRQTAEGEALAARIREWRAAEAKRLKVPAYVVLHDRTLLALAEARPKNPNELLVIDGIGPAKVERFGEDLLRLCAGK
jgi:superfamily II DNA helicase RecQ